MRQHCILVMMLEFQVLLSLLQQNDAENLSEHLHELPIRHVLIIILLLYLFFNFVYLGSLDRIFRHVLGSPCFSDTVVNNVILHIERLILLREMLS